MPRVTMAHSACEKKGCHHHAIHPLVPPTMVARIIHTRTVFEGPGSGLNHVSGTVPTVAASVVTRPNTRHPKMIKKSRQRRKLRNSLGLCRFRPPMPSSSLSTLPFVTWKLVTSRSTLLQSSCILPHPRRGRRPVRRRCRNVSDLKKITNNTDHPSKK